MKNEMTLSNGVKIEFTENGINVISADGELTQFDDNGKLLCKGAVYRAENFIKYFDFMGSEEQKIAREWAETTKGNTSNQVEFIDLVKEAAFIVDKDYYIANIEPSIDKTGRIYYRKGRVVACGLSCWEWKQKAREFAPECGSALATRYQLILWYAYRIAKGFWTIEYVCDDSSTAGNYENSPNTSYKLEASGAREVGGARDGVGNTYKIVNEWLLGGSFITDGHNYPVADGRLYGNYELIISYGSGVVVLNKYSAKH